MRVQIEKKIEERKKIGLELRERRRKRESEKKEIEKKEQEER